MTASELSINAQVASAYQRQRLWCGIVGIGCVLCTLWVILAWITLSAGAAEQLARLSGGFHPIVAAALTGLCAAGIATLAQLPADLAASAVERRFAQRASTGTLAYLGGVAQWCGQCAAGGALVGAAMVGPIDWAVSLSLLVGGAMLVAWVMPARPGAMIDERSVPSEWLEAVRAELGRLRLTLPRVRFFDHGERSLAGGWHGVGPLATLHLSRTITNVSPPVAAGLIAREIGHARMGHRYVTLIVSIAWALLGIGLARLLLPSSAASSPAALVLSVAAVCSTWAWLGLFVLPALGRRQVLAADAFARDAGMGQTGALAMLDELARRNLPDESLPPIVATVFHPIPPMADRRAAIRGESRVAASKAAGVAALV